MATTKTKRFKGLIALFLALVLTVGICGGVLAKISNGETVALTLHFTNFSYERSPLKFMHADGFLHTKTGTMGYETTPDGQRAYCLEFGNPSAPAVTASSVASYVNRLSTFQQRALTFATLYGYPQFSYGLSADEAWVATQVIIWEIVGGLRTGYNPTDLIAQDANGVKGNQFYKCLVEGMGAETAYNGILANMKEHENIPSFTRKTLAGSDILTLEWNDTTKRYEKTITDTRGILKNYVITNTLPAGVSASVSADNKLTVVSTNPITEASNVNIQLMRSLPTSAQSLLLLENGNAQKMCVGRASDPNIAYIKVKTQQGGIDVSKKGETLTGATTSTTKYGTLYTPTYAVNFVGGAVYEVLDATNKVVATLTTKATGAVSASLPAGDYTVREKTAPTGYAEAEEKLV